MWKVCSVKINKVDDTSTEANELMERGWEPFSVSCEGYDTDSGFIHAEYRLWLRKKSRDKERI